MSNIVERKNEKMKKGIISTVIGLFILVITLGSMNVVAAVNGTEVKGVISVNTVWEKAKGPYLITDNLLIDTNTLLTIEAGTEIIFEG